MNYFKQRWKYISFSLQRWNAFALEQDSIRLNRILFIHLWIAVWPFAFTFQYFVFDFHMAPAMLFDKIITLSVSRFSLRSINSIHLFVLRKRVFSFRMSCFTFHRYNLMFPIVTQLHRIEEIWRKKNCRVFISIKCVFTWKENIEIEYGYFAKTACNMNVEDKH